MAMRLLEELVGILLLALVLQAPPCHLLCFLLPTPFVAGVGCAQVRSVLG